MKRKISASNIPATPVLVVPTETAQAAGSEYASYEKNVSKSGL